MRLRHDSFWPLVLSIFFYCCPPSLLAEPLKFSVVSVDKDSSGFYIAQSLADEIGKRINREIQLIALPPLRAKEYLRSGEIDADFARADGFGTDIPGLIQVSEPIAKFPYYAYTIRKDILVDDWQSLLTYKVAYIMGATVPSAKLGSRHAQVNPINTAVAALNFLVAGRVDIFVSIPIVVDSLLNRKEFKNKGITALKTPIEVVYEYIYVNPKQAVLAEEIDAALKEMKKDKTYDFLMNRPHPIQE